MIENIVSKNQIINYSVGTIRVPSAPPHSPFRPFAGSIRTLATLQVNNLAPVVTNEYLKFGAMGLNLNFGAKNVRSHETLPSYSHKN